jgi:hypothetical protein
MSGSPVVIGQRKPSGMAYPNAALISLGLPSRSGLFSLFLPHRLSCMGDRLRCFTGLARISVAILRSRSCHVASGEDRGHRQGAPLAGPAGIRRVRQPRTSACHVVAVRRRRAATAPTSADCHGAAEGEDGMLRLTSLAPDIIEAILHGDLSRRSAANGRARRLATTKRSADGPQPGEAAEAPASAVG